MNINHTSLGYAPYALWMYKHTPVYLPTCRVAVLEGEAFHGRPLTRLKKIRVRSKYKLSGGSQLPAVMPWNVPVGRRYHTRLSKPIQYNIATDAPIRGLGCHRSQIKLAKFFTSIYMYIHTCVPDIFTYTCTVTYM